MADKTIEIEITTTSDTSGATSLKEELEATREEAEATSEAVDGLNDSATNIDSSSVENFNEQMQDTAEKTTEASDETEQLNDVINNLDPSMIDQLAESMSKYSDTTQESTDSTNELMEGLVSGGIATGLSSTFMGLADSAGTYNDSMLRMGLALSGHAMTVEQVSEKYGASVSKMAETTGRGAGSVRNHFANMGVAGIENTKILEDSFQAIASGSFYSGESIESLSNKFQRISMTGMLSAKQLSGLGLTMEDLAKVMGVSADEVSKKFKQMSVEQRASILSQASMNKFGTEVNDVYKNSWEGLWQQFDKAKAGLERLVGELLLPYLIPAVQTATVFVNGLADVFKALPQPVKDVMGGILLLMGGFTTLGLGLNAVMKIGKLVFAPFQSIGKLFGIDLKEKVKSLATSLKGDLKGAFTNLASKVKTVASDIKTTFVNALKSAKTFMTESLIPTIKNVATQLKTTFLGALKAVKTFMTESLIPAIKNAGKWLLNVGKNALTAGFNALKASALWAYQKLALVASTIAEYALASAQAVLNFVMSLNPIVIVVLALVALAGALIWAYYNVDWFREMVDNAWQSIVQFAQYLYGEASSAIQWLGDMFNSTGQTIQDSINNAINFVMDTLQNVWNYIMTLGGLLPQQVSITGNQIVDSILAVMIFMATLPAQIAMIFLNIIAKALGFGDNFTQNMIKGAVDSVNGFIQWIMTLPSKLQEEFNKMLEMASNFAMEIADRLTFGGASMVIGWLTGSGEHSPGFMYDALVSELEAMLQAPTEMLAGFVTAFTNMGMEIVSAFTETLFGLSITEIIDGIIEKINGLGESINWLKDYILTVGGLIPQNVSITGDQVIDTILRVTAFIETLPIRIAMVFIDIIARVLGFGNNFSSNMINGATNAVNGFLSKISGLASGIRDEFNRIISEASNFVGRIGQILWEAGANAIQNFLNGLGRHSPGIMQREFIAELNEMGERVPDESRQMIYNVGRLGKNIVDAFDTPNLNGKLNFGNANITGALTGNNNGMGNGDIVVNVYGDVDNEKRIQQIVDAVQREINWNNVTAGRSI